MRQRTASSEPSEGQHSTETRTVTNANTLQYNANEPSYSRSPRQQAVLRMQQTIGNAAVCRLLGKGTAATQTRSRAEEDEGGNIISDRQRPIQRDPQDGGTTDAGSGSSAQTATADAGTAAATTPTFPNIGQITADATVERERTADWTAGTSDFKERFAWVMWDSAANTFSVTGKTTGDADGVSPSARPSDHGTVYHVGEYHQHPPLPPGRDKTRFPVGAS